jgi:hypothetical protein
LLTRPLGFSGRILRSLRREQSRSTRSSHLIATESLARFAPDGTCAIIAHNSRVARLEVLVKIGDALK